MESFFESVDAFIRRNDLLDDGEPVLIGISGGVDSLVLASVLLRRGHPVTALHVNYQLRGHASDGDERFVESWCREHDVELVVRSFDTKARANERGESVQESARHLRYEAFETLAEARGIGKVALGHHRDDQAETLLLNLFRGTGPEGLAGMPLRRRIRQGSRVEVVRPLLVVRRTDIEQYAASRGMSWRHDATNADPKYRRGALRSGIIPLLIEHFGEAVVDNIARSAGLTREYLERTLVPDLEAAFAISLSETHGQRAVRLDSIRTLSPVLRRRVFIEAIRRWMPDVEADAHLAEQMEALSHAQPGRRIELGRGAVWRERGRLLFEPERDAASCYARQLEPGVPVSVPGGRIEAEEVPSLPEELAAGGPREVYVDARSVSFPLIVRPWKPGDRFRPLGMTGTKKISDFLTDERVAPHEKSDIPVVTRDDYVIWVVPLRIAHDARLSSDTKRVVRLRYTPTLLERRSQARPDENTGSEDS